MKQLLILLITTFALSMPAWAQEDTTRITEWEDTVDETMEVVHVDHGSQSDKNALSRILNGDVIDDDSITSHLVTDVLKSTWAFSIIALIIVFSLPILVIFLAFFFQYRSRKAKYKLAEQALAAGQPIPDEFIKANSNDNLRSKGISNLFTGLGLFVFLWILVDITIASVGLLVMFIGIGQIVTYNANNGKGGK